MASTGSVSAWDEALLTAMIQYPVPVIKGPEDIQTQVEQICKCVASTKAGYPDLDLIVFPEYSTQGLNTKIWTYDEMLLRIDSPETVSLCPQHKYFQCHLCVPVTIGGLLVRYYRDTGRISLQVIII